MLTFEVPIKCAQKNSSWMNGHARTHSRIRADGTQQNTLRMEGGRRHGREDYTLVSLRVCSDDPVRLRTLHHFHTPEALFGKTILAATAREGFVVCVLHLVTLPKAVKV